MEVFVERQTSIEMDGSGDLAPDPGFGSGLQTQFRGFPDAAFPLGREHGDVDEHANLDPNGHADLYVHGHGHVYAEPCIHVDLDAHGFDYGDAHVDAYAQPDADGVTHQYNDRDRDRDLHPDPDEHADADEYGYP